MSKITKARRRQTTGAADDFPDFSDGAEFDALSAEDKEKVARFYEQGKHRKEVRPLNAAERAQVKREKKRMGRPKIGRGVKVVSLSVERDLLKKADAYANRSDSNAQNCSPAPARIPFGMTLAHSGREK